MPSFVEFSKLPKQRKLNLCSGKFMDASESFARSSDTFLMVPNFFVLAMAWELLAFEFFLVFWQGRKSREIRRNGEAHNKVWKSKVQQERKRKESLMKMNSVLSVLRMMLNVCLVCLFGGFSDAFLLFVLSYFIIIISCSNKTEMDEMNAIFWQKYQKTTSHLHQHEVC